MAQKNKKLSSLLIITVGDRKGCRKIWSGSIEEKKSLKITK